MECGKFPGYPGIAIPTPVGRVSLDDLRNISPWGRQWMAKARDGHET